MMHTVTYIVYCELYHNAAIATTSSVYVAQ